MGTDKRFRNEYVTGGQKVVGNSTYDGNLKVTGTLTHTGAVVNTTSALTVQSVTASSGVNYPVQAVNSTATAVNLYGLSKINSTKAGTLIYPLGAPIAGREKIITIGTITGSSALRVVRTATAITIGTTVSAASHKIRFTKTGQSVHLIGASTVSWLLAGSNGGPTYSASTTTT